LTDFLVPIYNEPEFYSLKTERSVDRMKNFIRDHFPRSYLVGKWLYYWLLALPYLGYGVECPCCDAHFRRFARFHGRPDICPRCWSTERHRAVFRYLVQETDLFQAHLKILHFAPDALERKLRAAPNLEYLSADLVHPRAMEHFDIRHIPYPANSFDMILCSHVLEYIPDDRLAMSELYRVLKPGGWALLLDPVKWDQETSYEVTDPQERKRLFGQEGNIVRIYGRDYLDRLAGVGFTVTRLPEYNQDMVLARKSSERDALAASSQMGERNAIGNS
jgi:SAM-dependent methyltransferase